MLCMLNGIVRKGLQQEPKEWGQGEDMQGRKNSKGHVRSRHVLKSARRPV